MNLAGNELLEQLTTAVLSLTPALVVDYLNPAAQALLGASDSRAVGAAISDIVHPDDPELLTQFEAVRQSGQSLTRRAVRLQKRDGSEAIIDLTVSRDPGSGNLIVEMQPINRFIRINRDEQSLFSQETSRLLVRGLAHEIKNPLGGVRGAAQLLERELDQEHLKEYTRVIIDEADRLKTLVDRMLGPNTRIDRRSVNVHAVLEHVIRLINAETDGDIAFERDYDPSLPPVVGDESQLIQAFLNIVANAAQALENTPQPLVRMRTRSLRRFTIGPRLHRLVLQVDITDNGPGIPADMLERIYFPMISGRPEGTGLGLAITQTIISQHGGVIECNSRPGRTCFTVHLPLEDSTRAERSLGR